jgi:pimeloyl-ACP methyl ester carboxylesterase
MTFTNYPKAKLNYIDKGTGEPLIFLHGLLYDIDIYKGLIDILSERYHVYAIDLPMHGKTKILETMTTQEFSKILNEFIEEKKIKDPIVIGHSFGALVAIFYASRFKVKKLILIEPSGLKYYNNHFSPAFRILVIQPILCLKENFAKSIPLFYTVIKNILKIISSKKILKYLDEDLFIDHSDTLEKIRCQTTIFWARDDEIIPFSFAEGYKKKIKDSELIEIKGTHNWLILKPKLAEKYLR